MAVITTIMAGRTKNLYKIVLSKFIEVNKLKGPILNI